MAIPATKVFEKFEIATGGSEGKMVYNFSPGPCILPRAVLDKCAEDMVNYRGTHQSVMELGHRKPEFMEMSDMTKEEIRRFLKVPEDYTVMLNQGGATQQYTAVFKNLIGLKPARKAMYFTTGLWSNQCLAEARKFSPAENLIEVTCTKESNYTQLTDPWTWNIDPEASFLHVCVNETVHGFEITEDNFPWEKFPKDMVVVGDMSSNIGTRPINWDRFQVVYAGAQKNMGPTGVTIIIVKKSLLGRADRDVPIMCDWATFEKSAGSYYNTPPVWAIYVTGLNVSYMNQKGGLCVYDREAAIKSGMLYSLLDNSKGYYINRTQKDFRSRINVNFRICDDRTLEKKLMEEAEKVKIVNIAGHPMNPGIRVSLYNAMPVDGVVQLCHFLERFMKENPIKGSARL